MGQSSWWWPMPGAALSPSATSLTSPLAVQTSSNPWGWTRGEATATPSVTANQANISRVSQNEERSACMGRDYGLGAGAGAGFGAGVDRVPLRFRSEEHTAGLQ